MKSSKTTEELHAMAMLMGMWYDPTDHTFNKRRIPEDSGTETVLCIDADTMVPISAYEDNTIEGIRSWEDWQDKRFKQVKCGEIGASDYAKKDN